MDDTSATVAMKHDESGYDRAQHVSVRTIYPPQAQI
jgi:hypothetical protein